MNIDVFIKIFKNKHAVLTFSTTDEKVNNNEELKNEFDANFFYVEEGLKINKGKVLNNFPKLNLFLKNNNSEINFSFFMNDDEQEIETLIRFLKENKNLPITIEINSYKYLIDNFAKDDLPNLKIKFKNNLYSIEFKEFFNMYIFLKQIIDFIKYYNLSPLEQVILVYDIIKSKEYIKENKNEDPSLSRSLNEVIKSGKIVCLGYANLINFILDALGIENKKIYLSYTDHNRGHARNLIYLKDEKYNINGFFVSDATLDSKDSSKKQNYLNNYYYFLKPLKVFDNKNEIIKTPLLLNALKLNDSDLKKYLTHISIEDKFLIFRQLNEFLDQLSIQNLNWNVDKNNHLLLIEKIKYIQTLFNETIPYIAFKNALYRVRNIEFANNIIKNKINEKELDKICDIFFSKIIDIKKLKKDKLYIAPKLNSEESKGFSIEKGSIKKYFSENDFIKKM